ncbi:PspA/IM30 family protein [Actinotalea sp. Marseille-Q4924]|uniref:PspA/IM30 family protein n=1 Tax=Actinotalea sp. Marseille-Q4924 TaxID=2866571 RepID=UPI001CE3F62A|nr:PspA/IM30 family protein [Actinotalea sp. Marseille-Q4924]
MTEKQSIIGRMTQLARANINALIDQAEDPQKMLDQLVRDYTSSIGEAERAIAQTIGNLRLAEQDHNEDVAAAREWGDKAVAASTRADQYRTQGDTTNADRFDQLAKIALQKQIGAETEAKESEPLIASQRDTVEKLKLGLSQMKDKLGQLKTRRDTLVARQKAAEAQQQVQGAISSINVMDPTSELARFEERVRREEAMAMGQAEIAASSLESQFAELEDAGTEIEVEARLAALKAGTRPTAQIEAWSVTPEIEAAREERA